MKIIKKFKIFIVILVFITFKSSFANSAEECFEGTSRAIFKFNMAVDEAILEPLAKGYNKLPTPIKSGANNFTSNIGLYYQSLIIFCKEISNNLVIQLVVLL